MLGGKVLATGGWDARVRIWDAATGRKLREIGKPSERGLRGLAAMPDGRTLVVADGAKRIRFWDVTTGKLIRELERDEDIMQGQTLAVAPDGKTLAVAGL
jgi:WD40 repeat protein